MTSIIDTTTASRASSKNEDYFHECIKVKFTDETNTYRSLVTSENKVDLHLYRLENGNILRVELSSPDHDSLVFRRDFTERSFKEDPYFRNQELTFDFKALYQVISDFVRSMPANKNSFIRCTIHKHSSNKCSCELGLVAAALTSKPAFKIRLDVLSGSHLIEHLEKINDSTKKKFKNLCEKYCQIKSVEKHVEELSKQVDEYKLKEHKHWQEKTQHQQREVTFLVISNENTDLKQTITELEAELNVKEQDIASIESDYEDLKQNFLELENDYDQLSKSHSKQAELISKIGEAHAKTQKERDSLRKERDQLRKEKDQLRKEKDQLRAEVERLQSKNKTESSIISGSKILSSIQLSKD